jgi:hypothetical protein
LRIVGVLAGSVVLGGVTSFAQGLLPEALSSFANSPSGWTILTVAMVAAARLRSLAGATLGAASFLCLVLGYTVASELRGLSYDPVFWGAVGVVAGPVVGLAASAMVGREPRGSAVGSALVAAVLISDAVYGLTVVADTTSPVYWILIALLAVTLLALVAVGRLRSWRLVAGQLLCTLLFVAIGLAGYAVPNGYYGM